MLPPGATLQSAELHGVWVIFFWTGVVVTLIVLGLIAYCVVRFRADPRATAFPTQVRRNDKLEITYTIIPLLMVCALFAVTYPAERHVEALASNSTVSVEVTGFRWSWRFAYPKLGISVIGTRNRPPVLVLPLGRTTRLDVTSVDVAHSFWVPAFLFKRDAIPGLRNSFDWTPKQLGRFRGVCGEFCGLDHATMAFEVVVVPPAEFIRWAAGRGRVALERSPSSL